MSVRTQSLLFMMVGLAIAEFPALPVGFEAGVRSDSRAQCRLTGYRLVDLLGSFVRPEGASPT